MTNPEFLVSLKELVRRAETEEDYINYLVDDVAGLIDDYEGENSEDEEEEY